MKMRELERRTGYDRETIRFYIRERLLPQPERTKPNVANYSEEHVEALAAIRGYQQDPHLTLGMIRRLLAGQATPISDAGSGFSGVGARLEQRLNRRSRHALVAVAELAERMPLAPRYIEAFTAKGIVTPQQIGGEMFLDSLDAQLVEGWVGSRAKGFSEALGFGPDGIDAFVEAMEGLAPVVVEFMLSRLRGHYTPDALIELHERNLPDIGIILEALFIRSTIRELKRRTAGKTPKPAPDKA